MTTRNRNARTNRNTARAATPVELHELDQVVVDQTKTRVKAPAAALLSAISKAEKAAAKNIAKREAFLEESAEMKQLVREAYDEGSESAIAEVQTAFDAYSKSLLRATRR